ncbi:MAG: 4Fe-4S ferredoxin, partial [Candidatus Ratteibacteria bacterium]
GKNTIRAHLKHLHQHGETEYLKQALEVLKEKHIDIDLSEIIEVPCCPGMKIVERTKQPQTHDKNISVPSQLRQWPVQLHLINPLAPYFKNADLLIAADCTAYAYGNFHNEFLTNKSIVIACPKLDQGIDRYVEKIRQLIDDVRINTITVVVMEVPCCMGLVKIVEQATQKTKRKVPVKQVVVSIEGKILEEQWI